MEMWVDQNEDIFKFLHKSIKSRDFYSLYFYAEKREELFVASDFYLSL